MSVIRQANILGQQRLDVPHLRAIESSIAADFDLLAGRVLAGDKALVVRGMEIVTSNAIGNPATDLQLVVANSIIMHSLASEHGTIFSVPADQAVEDLNSTNPNVSGSFTAGQVNYIGLDLRRVADDTTADLVQFMDANTLLETPKNVPLARTLQYKIVISTTDFSSTPNLLPICKVTTNSTNTVTVLEDARALNFRLGTGGSVPDKYHGFPWTAGRQENLVGSVFTGGDKGITSTKDWMDAVMTRLWEVGGGQYWYSATSDREVKLVGGAPTIVATSDNFQWTLGSQTLQWQSLTMVFGNSAVPYNTVVDGSAVLLDNQCLYVDIDRSQIVAALAKVADLTTLGQSAVPGQRFIIAWRRGNEIFVKDHPYEMGRAYVVANTVIDGMVKLKYVAGTPSNPLVLAAQTDGGYVNIADSANGHAFTGTGNGTGSGFFGTGGGGAGPGIKGTGGAGGLGGDFQGTGAGNGIRAIGGITAGSIGVFGQGGSGGGRGGDFLGILTAEGIRAQGGATGHGGVFTGGASGGSGLTATSQFTGVAAIVASATAGNAVAVNATGFGTGAGITATGGANGNGGTFTANGTGIGIAVTAAGSNKAATFTGGSGSTAISIGVTGGGVNAIDCTSGDIQILSGNNFKTATAVTRTAHCTPMDCNFFNGGQTNYANWWPGGPGSNAIRGNGWNSFSVTGRFLVPNGATVTGVQISMSSESTATVLVNNIDVVIHEYDNIGGSYTGANNYALIGATTTLGVGAAAAWRVPTGAWTNRVVKDGYVAINFSVAATDAIGHFVYFYGARLTYTMTNVVPVT